MSLQNQIESSLKLNMSEHVKPTAVDLERHHFLSNQLVLIKKPPIMERT